MYVYVNHCRRKFRSQTSDNMDRWKSRGGKSQRGEEPKREDQRRVIVRRKLTSWAFLDVQIWFCVAGARDSTPCQKRAKREGLVAVPKTMAGLGHLQRICKDARGRRSARDMFIRDVRRSGRWFPERGLILEHQIRRFTKMILRDKCSTSYGLALIFRGRRSALDRWSGKIAKRTGTRLSALHSTFHFWSKSRRIASFLMLPTPKKWGSLAELSRYVSFLTLSSSKIEEVSQTCCVFDVAKFKNWGSLAE